MVELFVKAAGATFAGCFLFYILCRLATAAYFKSRNDAGRQ